MHPRPVHAEVSLPAERRTAVVARPDEGSFDLPAAFVSPQGPGVLQTWAFAVLARHGSTGHPAPAPRTTGVRGSCDAGKSARCPTTAAAAAHRLWRPDRRSASVAGFAPRLPVAGGMTSVRVRSCVPSCWSAPVRVTETARPRARVSRWCFNPAVRRSVGFGPAFYPRKRPARRHRPSPPATRRSGPLGAAWPALRGAAGPARRPAASRVAAAGSSCPTRSPTSAGIPPSPRQASTSRRSSCPTRTDTDLRPRCAAGRQGAMTIAPAQHP